MRKLGLLLLPILAITLMLGGNALAQNVGDSSVYFVTYYSNANTAGIPDGTLRLINDGDQATTDVEGKENGTLWAAIYVFNDSQVMVSCCACQITSDGLLSESVNKQLTSNEFTAHTEITRGVIKVVSSLSDDPTTPVPTPGLRGWMTHIQRATNLPEGGASYVTETALTDSNLGKTELSDLGTVCSFGYTIASGPGACLCTAEDNDF
jgi:hypothetical protein